jgi:hypothetical protein
VAKFFSSRIAGAERLHRLFQIEEQVKARLRDVIEKALREVLASAQSKVSGSVLKQRKGKLLRSLKMETYETPNGPGGRVFSKWYIARFYEMGFGGKTVKVDRHTRKVKSRNVRGEVVGKDGKVRRKKIAQGIAYVKQHERKLPRIHKSFLKSSLDEKRPAIRAAFKAATTGVR